MKLSAKPKLAMMTTAFFYSRKGVWTNSLMGLILVSNIILYLFALTLYKASYTADTFISRHPLLLWIIAVSPVFLAIMIIRWRTDLIRSQENQKNIIKKEMLYLEAKALRAQMNPHFIFNCMNSIKSLINDDKEKATTYLICFSKLIRTIFQNSDKREITLYDEIETCRLYTQLEGMRFGNKFRHVFKIDETLDLKSIMVPALILQPFIENAIWHGIVPKDAGGILAITVDSINNTIRCVIDDDGIGMDMSTQNKFKGASPMHESKGVHLTQARLDLDNLLNERNATIEIIEKKDENGNSSGTTVILSFLELTRVNHSFDINKTKLSLRQSVY